MKALKEFDYNLWTTEENGVKKYFVGVKATGEVTEVDAEVMKVLRNEEKKMRRHIEEEVCVSRRCNKSSHGNSDRK